jgi:AraC-like DNA-binding protein
MQAAAVDRRYAPWYRHPMTFVRQPSPRLRPYVARYAGYRFDGAEAQSHAGLPSRHLTLVISLSGPITVAGPTGIHAFNAFVSGLHATPVRVTGTASPCGMRLFLTPLGARALLGTTSAELAGQTVDLFDLLPGGRDELLGRLHEAAGWERRFDVIDDLLERCLLDDVGFRPGLRHAWSRLLDSDGTASIAGLAHETGWSRRHLGQVFAEEIGLSPKRFARIVRFEHACRLIRRGGALAGVAAESGYADQPHLGRDWTEITDSTPRDWIRRELPFLQDYEIGGALSPPS